jgi:hypothetical protein
MQHAIFEQLYTLAAVWHCDAALALTNNQPNNQPSLPFGSWLQQNPGHTNTP